MLFLQVNLKTIIHINNLEKCLLNDLSYPCLSRETTSKIPIYPVVPAVCFGILSVTVKAVSRMGKLSGLKLPIHGQNNHLIVKGKNKLSEIKGCRSS